MQKVTLTHQQVLEFSGQLQILKMPQMDGPKDLRARMDPLVSLKVARITEALEKEAALLEKTVTKLNAEFAQTNADGVNVPGLTPKTPVLDTICKHLSDQLGPCDTTGSNDWKCASCGQVFSADNRVVLLNESKLYFERRTSLMEDVTTFSTVQLTEDDVRKFPDVAPGVMQALIPFIRFET